MADEASATTGNGAGARPQSVGSVHVNTDKLSSSYCNVCMVNSTREEVVLSFGVNQDWDRNAAQMEVALLKRIILSPHGAKRLHQRLAHVLAEYEKRYGELQATPSG